MRSASSRQIVFAGAGSLQISEQRLARFLEPLQVGAELFELAPSHAERLRLQHDRFDAGIDGGFAQHHPHISHSGPMRSAKAPNGTSTGAAPVCHR